jgi:hypothetical protein
MRKTVWMLGLLVLAGGAAQAQDCRLKQYDSIPFAATPAGLTLPVEIGGAKRDLAFNLGATRNALATDTVEALDLHETHLSQEHNVHSGGVAVLFEAHAPLVKIGASAIHNMDFLVLPAVGNSGRPAGEIGALALANDDLELDMAAKRLNLFADTHCPGKAVYWTTTGFAKVPLEIGPDGYVRASMMLDGKPVSLGLTTNVNSVLGIKAAKRLFGLDSDSPGMTLAFTAAHGVKYYRYSFHALSVDGLTVNNPTILIRDDSARPDCIVGQRLSTTMDIDTGVDLIYNAMVETSCHAGEDGALGLSVLEKLHLYLSRKEKLLYLTGADAK